MRNNGTVGGNVNIPYKDSASYRGLDIYALYWKQVKEE